MIIFTKDEFEIDNIDFRMPGDALPGGARIMGYVTRGHVPGNFDGARFTVRLYPWAYSRENSKKIRDMLYERNVDVTDLPSHSACHESGRSTRDAELRDWHGGPPKIDFSYT